MIDMSQFIGEDGCVDDAAVNKFVLEKVDTFPADAQLPMSHELAAKLRKLGFHSFVAVFESDAILTIEGLGEVGLKTHEAIEFLECCSVIAHGG